MEDGRNDGVMLASAPTPLPTEVLPVPGPLPGSGDAADGAMEPVPDADPSAEK